MIPFYINIHSKPGYIEFTGMHKIFMTYTYILYEF